MDKIPNNFLSSELTVAVKDSFYFLHFVLMTLGLLKCEHLQPNNFHTTEVAPPVSW